MEKINIMHYCHSLCMPLQNITELPETEAYKFADKLEANNATAFGRFKDFKNYYPRRIETEKMNGQGNNIFYREVLK